MDASATETLSLPTGETEVAPEVATNATATPTPAPRKSITTSAEDVKRSMAEAKEAILKAAQPDPQPLVPDPGPQAPAAPPAATPVALPALQPEAEPGTQRKHRRITVNVRAKMAQAGRPPEDARLTDLSLGGVGLLTDRSLPMGAMCHVMFRLTMPSGQIQTVVAQAQALHSAYSARHGGFKSGFKFGKLPEPAMLTLTEFISDKTRTGAL